MKGWQYTCASSHLHFEYPTFKQTKCLQQVYIPDSSLADYPHIVSLMKLLVPQTSSKINTIDHISTSSIPRVKPTILYIVTRRDSPSQRVHVQEVSNARKHVNELNYGDNAWCSFDVNWKNTGAHELCSERRIWGRIPPLICWK